MLPIIEIGLKVDPSSLFKFTTFVSIDIFKVWGWEYFAHPTLTKIRAKPTEYLLQRLVDLPIFLVFAEQVDPVV